MQSLDNHTGDTSGTAYFSGHKVAVTDISHDQKLLDHNQSIVCSCDHDGITMLWAVTKRVSFLSKSYTVTRHPIRLYRAFPSAFTCCDLSLELGIVVVGSRNLVSIFSIEYNMKLRDIDVNADICSSQGYLTNGVIVKCYIKRIALSNYGSITLFLEKEILHNEMESVKITHILASYSVNGHLTVLLELACSVTCLDCPKREHLLLAGCSDGSVLFLLQGSLEIVHNIKPVDNCKIYNPKPSTANFPEDGQPSLTENYIPIDLNSPITCIKSGPSPDYPALVAACNAAGDMFLIPLPDYVRWDRVESSKNIIANIVQTPISVIRGTIQQAQNITEHAAGSISRRILDGRAAVGGAINRVSSKTFRMVANVFLFDMSLLCSSRHFLGGIVKKAVLLMTILLGILLKKTFIRNSMMKLCFAL